MQAAILDYFPFTVTRLNANSSESSFQLLAQFDAAALAAYRLLFERYSPPGRLISLVDLSVLLIEEKAPELLDTLSFDEEGYELDIHAESESDLAIVRLVICPVWQDLAALEEYVQRLTGVR